MTYFIRIMYDDDEKLKSIAAFESTENVTVWIFPISLKAKRIYTFEEKMNERNIDKLWEI